MRICTQHQGEMHALECPAGIQCTSLCVLTHQCSARVPSRCPPQGPIWVPFGVCAFLGLLSGFLCGRVPQGESPLECPLTEIPLATCMPAHPAPLIALSEGTQVTPTFVRRCYDKTNTRFSWDCTFRMNIFPSQKHFVLYTTTIYQREKGFCKKYKAWFMLREKEGGEGGDTK
jgi:hypothetical protein